MNKWRFSDEGIVPLSPQQAPKFDPVRHALDIATGIVEAP